VVAQIEIVSERQGSSGWIFTAQVLDDEGELRRHRVSLSWADYNVWSASGADEPAEVAAGALRFLVSRAPAAALRGSFDAALIRRLFPEADAEIPRHIRDLG